MRIVEPWNKKVWKLFFQSAEEHRKEMQMCEKAHRNYLLGFSTSPPFSSSHITKKKFEDE